MWPPNGLTQQRVKATTVTAGIWMEFIEGRTLADLLEAQGPVSAREAARVGRDLCRALAALNPPIQVVVNCRALASR